MAGILRAAMKTRCEILVGFSIVRSSAAFVLPGRQWRFNRQRSAFGCSSFVGATILALRLGEAGRGNSIQCLDFRRRVSSGRGSSPARAVE